MQTKFQIPEDQRIQTPVGAVDRKNAAGYLGVSIRTLDTEASSGRLRRTMIGSKPVFRIKHLEEYLDSKLAT